MNAVIGDVTCLETKGRLAWPCGSHGLFAARLVLPVTKQKCDSDRDPAESKQQRTTKGTSLMPRRPE